VKRTILWDSLLLFLLASVLIWPLYRLKYLDNWSSIESTFIGDGRMLAENLPHPGWQPLWYCGTRFDYIYPPALRYGTALISKIPRVVPARAYHLYIATFYALGIVAVYWLVMAGCGSRKGAWLAAAGVALLSPSFLLLPLIRQDSAYLVPQRLHALMTYGEGPHISGLSVLTAALAVLFLALRTWRPGTLVGAGFLCAFAVTNNFYAATSLAIFVPILTWAVWLGERNRFVWLRSAGVVLLSYGLCAFWLTPSYLKLTVTNLKWISQPASTLSQIAAGVVILVFCAVSFWLANRRPDRIWNVFLVGTALIIALNVFATYLGFRVAGDGVRLIPELDIVLILLLVQLVRGMWHHPKWRIAAAVLAIVAFSPAARYLKHVYSPFPKAQDIENRYEYRIAKWSHDNLTGERMLPSGTVRFWFNVWFDSVQADGGSAQGMLNQNIPWATWEIERGARGDLAALWLQALGTRAVIVPDRTSPEPYGDYTYPKKFRGVLAVLYDDRHGTVVYRVPHRFPGIGRVIDRARLAPMKPVRGGDDERTLTEYVAIVENPEQSATSVVWQGTDAIDVQAQVSNGQSVLLQETYDPYWSAYENARQLSIRPDPVMGFMLIDVPEGSHSIHLHFETPLENRVGQVIFALSLAVLVALVLF
jgi:hypothetical protein